MHLLKAAALATVAVGATGGIALAADQGSRPAEPGRTLPTTAATPAQEHAGPVLAGHSAHPNSAHGHAYGRDHGTGKPAGVGKPTEAGGPVELGTPSHPAGPPFSVPPVSGRPSSTPPVPVPPVPTPSHPSGRPSTIPSHSHPAPSGPPTPIPSHSHP